MASRNHFLFYLALVITVLFHFMAVKPIAHWMNRNLMPLLTDESIEIDLAEIKARTKFQKFSDAVPPAQSFEKPQPAPIVPEIPDQEKPEWEPLPKEKKVLDPNLTEDRIVPPETPVTPPGSDKPILGQKQAAITPKAEEEDKEQKVAKEDEVVSPLFIKQPDKAESPAGDQPKKKTIPEEIKETIRNGTPEKTEDEKLEFSMNTYRWTFQRYMENWAIDIQKWWKPPLDYVMGNVPEGGDMWIQVKLAKTGRLQGYRILNSDVTAEMELMVIQALVGSLARPSMPGSFPEDSLIINWHFIYPPLRPQLDMRR
jgi:hypothetical protein